MKIIKITIDPTGKPTIEAEGFHGIGCAAATKPIEDALSAAGDRQRTEKMEMAIGVPVTAADYLSL
jgi:hypothetical protein